MIFPEVKYLYKYMPWSEFTPRSLSSERFWFSSPDRFNDLYDCSIPLKTRALPASLEGMLDGFNQALRAGVSSATTGDSSGLLDAISNFGQKFSQNQPELVQDAVENERVRQISISLSKRLSRLAILCLCEYANNILMWSHYASQHKGICVEFERSSQNLLGDKNKTLPIRYSIRKPEIDAEEYRGGSEKEKTEIERTLIYTKANDWSYEREWRVCLNEGSNQAFDLKCKIRSVIIGARADVSTIDELKKLSELKGFALRQARMRNEDFGVDIVSLG